MALFGPTDWKKKTTFVNHSKCYVGSEIPGKKITKSFGLISQVTKNVDYNINKALAKILEIFVNEAINIGANVIINFRCEVGTAQEQFSSFQTAFIILYGEAVIAE